MTNIQNNQRLEEELAYDEVSQKDGPIEEKLDLLNKTLASIHEKKQSSFHVVFNITNTMLGSALLVMPINYYNSGLLSSIFASIVLAAVSCVTCDCLITHSRDDEIDLPEALRRILGPKFELLFNVIACFMLYLVGIIHFILMANTLFNILKSIFDSNDWPKTTDVVFNQFSVQWTGIILFFVCIFLFNLKTLRAVLSINDKGVYMIIFFCVFLIYLGVNSLFKYDITFSMTGTPGKNNKGLELILFTDNLQNLIGVFALAFFNHNLIVGIMKNHEDSRKGHRDLYISYSVVWLIYLILGMLGMFAVAGLFSEIYDKSVNEDGKIQIPETIMDLLIKSNPGLNTVQFIFAILGMLLIFTQLTSVIPIFCFFSRRMFFNLFYPPNHQLENWKFYSFNAFFNVSCLVIQVLALEPSKVIALTGAIGGFVLIYVLPIMIHLKCLYWNKRSQTPNPNNKQTEQNRSKSYKTIDEEKLLSDELMKYQTDKEENESKECRDHSDYKPKNIILIYMYYGAIFIFGVVILVFQLV